MWRQAVLFIVFVINNGRDEGYTYTCYDRSGSRPIKYNNKKLFLKTLLFMNCPETAM